MKTIIHVIDSLNRGGAEILLEGTVLGLPSYRHIIVCLNNNEDYNGLLKRYLILNLNFSKKIHLFRAIKNLKVLIKEYKVDVVHSHLYWGTIISRLAVPKETTLISTYHSLLYDPLNKAQYSQPMLLLDQLTYKKRYHTLFVSDAVKKLVSRKIGIKENSSVVHNYVEDKFFINTSAKIQDSESKLKVVSVGNLRPEKNYPLILKAFSKLSAADIELHIYGEGNQRQELESQIFRLGLTNVNLKGRSLQVEEILPAYHLFLSASSFEGFGIAVIESMAIGVPCLLSDIPAHVEVASDNALYFPSQNVDALAKKLTYVLKNRSDLLKFVNLGKLRAETFRKETYLRKINNLYQK